MSFEINERHLHRLCEVNNFPVPMDRMIFFGIRGCLQVNTSDQSFQPHQSFNLMTVDYMSPRCTLGQWRPADGTFAGFPGSTSPHISYYSNGRGANANQLMPGYYSDYRKGKHKPGKKTGHDAFRQTVGCPVRRTFDDMDYDNLDDTVEYEFKMDNLHAGWCLSVNSTKHASAGCQVVVGFPKCDARPGQPESGPWKTFRTNAYNLAQNSFPYVLLDGIHVQEVVQKTNDSTPISVRLRFGSKGPLVTQVQNALKRKGFYEGEIDDDFQTRMLRAVLAFQTAQFGEDADNGVVGPLTAQALRVRWPTV